MRQGLDDPAIPAGAPAAARPRSGAFWRRRWRATAPLAVGGVVAFAALGVLLYYASVHAFPPNSDGATVVLEGRSMASGELALHGWALSLDSFWGVDALVYMVAILVVGLKAALLHLVPALIAATVVLVGALVARGRARGGAGVAGAATVVALLAFPSHALAMFFLQGPLHIGTVLWCLIAFVGLRSGRFGWGWVVAVVFLAAGVLGDLQTIALGTAPALLAGIVASARCRKWLAGAPAASAAVVSIGLAYVVREIAKAIGTFTLINPNPRATSSVEIANLSLLGNYFAKIFGAGTNGFGGGGAPYFTEFARGIGLVSVIVGVLVAVCALVVGIVRGRDTATDTTVPWRLEDLLVFAFFGGLVVFIALTVQPIPAYARYLTASAIYGSILCGCLVRRLAGRLARHQETIPPVLVRSAALVFVAVVALLATSLGFELAHPAPGSPYPIVERFLADHDLRNGIGDYWSSSLVTVETDGHVRVRPVTQAPDGKLVRYDRESTTSWYTGHTFRFLVYNPDLIFGNVDAFSAAATFGRPAHSYTVGGLVVLVWSHPITVSPVGIA